MNINIVRGNDGFGSQLFSIISGIAFSKKNNYQYMHTELQGIKLLDKPDCQNKELDRANKLINDIIINLKLPFKTQNDKCLTRPFFHEEILNFGVEHFYNQSFLDLLSSSYPLSKPSYYSKDATNIAIHIRRGSDIFHPGDIKARIVENDIYENIIRILDKKIKNPIFHIFSWSDPNLNLTQSNIIKHISKSGDVFLDDFNALVHSDILVVGSSTFSISAGFFNKNMVLCDTQLCKLNKTPYPTIWNDNFKRMICETTN